MTEITVQAGDIKGLTPAVNAVNSQETYALSGRNYVFDSLGPKSAFGSRVVNGNPLHQLSQRRGVQVLRASNRILFLTNETILELDVVTGKLIPQIMFEPFTEIHRWTHGFLNGVDYFCHPGVGILFWDQRTGERGLHQQPGVPSSPIAIVVDNGRLGVMDAKAFTWSAPSNGKNFVPKLGGAGVQAIADRISGEPIMISSYSRGVLIWTTQGVMRSEFSGGVEVYRHRGINTEYRPINSFCVAKLDDDTTVILDPRGLFASRGEPPTPFAPLFNEFLIEELKANDSLVGNNTRLEWDAFARRLYISRSFTPIGELYTQSFVLYVPLQKWGSFDFAHYGVGLGYWIDSAGFLKQFDGGAAMLDVPVDSTAHAYDVPRAYPQMAQRRRESTSLSSTIRLAALPESQNTALITPGFFNYNATAAIPPVRSGLDSLLLVGHFRLPVDTFADQMIQVNTVHVGSVISRKLSTSDIDYSLVPPGVSNEDYNVAIGGEDFGLNPVSFINFQIRDLGSLDGQTVFVAKTPALGKFNDSVRIYAGGANGIWHQIELLAATAGEYFHLRYLQLNGVPSGRLL